MRNEGKLRGRLTVVTVRGPSPVGARAFVRSPVCLLWDTFPTLAGSIMHWSVAGKNSATATGGHAERVATG